MAAAPPKEGDADTSNDDGRIMTQEQAAQVEIDLALAEGKADFDKQANLAGDLAEWYNSQGDAVKAEGFINRELTAIEKLDGKTARYADALIHLALVKMQQRKTKEAVLQLNQCIQIEDGLKVQVHHGYLPLAKVLLAIGDVTTAEPILMKCQEEVEAAFGVNAVELCDVLPTLALVRLRRNRTDPRAKAMFDRTLDIASLNFGPESIEVATALSAMVPWFQLTQDAEGAIATCQRTVNICTALKHPMLISALQMLTGALVSANRKSEALVILLKHKDALEAECGQQHPAVRAVDGLYKSTMSAQPPPSRPGSFGSAQRGVQPAPVRTGAPVAGAGVYRGPQTGLGEGGAKPPGAPAPAAGAKSATTTTVTATASVTSSATANSATTTMVATRKTTTTTTTVTPAAGANGMMTTTSDDSDVDETRASFARPAGLGYGSAKPRAGSRSPPPSAAAMNAKLEIRIGGAPVSAPAAAAPAPAPAAAAASGASSSADAAESDDDDDEDDDEDDGPPGLVSSKPQSPVVAAAPAPVAKRVRSVGSGGGSPHGTPPATPPAGGAPKRPPVVPVAKAKGKGSPATTPTGTRPSGGNNGTAAARPSETSGDSSGDDVGVFEHPNIADATDLELDEFESLDVLLRRRQKQNKDFNQEIVVGWFDDIVKGLQHVGTFGVVHRDLKPQNILIHRDGRVKVANFATIGSQASLATRVGSAHFTAPEVLGGGVVSTKSDMFSLGVILYRLLCLEYPFKGATFAELSAAIRAAVPAPLPAKIAKRTSKRLQTLCMRLLNKDPADRPSINDVAQALRGIKDQDLDERLEASLELQREKYLLAQAVKSAKLEGRKK